MANKVIFRESEYSEFDCLYDDDFIRGKGGSGYEDAILYVIAGSDYPVTNKNEYQALCSRVDNIANDFYDLLHNNGYYFRTFKEICQYYGIKYSPVMVHKLKAFAESYDDRSFDDIAAFLTITTGKEWDTYQVCGYCQGDYATGIYCKNHWDAESLELYVGAAAGTVSEFCRIEDGFECWGYYVTDDIKWNEDKLREYLSSMEGDKPEDIQIELFNGYSQVASYKTI